VVILCAVLASMLEQVNKEEQEFEKQYNEWLMQYNTWKEQNKSKVQYLISGVRRTVL